MQLAWSVRGAKGASAAAPTWDGTCYVARYTWSVRVRAHTPTNAGWGRGGEPGRASRPRGSAIPRHAPIGASRCRCITCSALVAGGSWRALAAAGEATAARPIRSSGVGTGQRRQGDASDAIKGDLQCHTGTYEHLQCCRFRPLTPPRRPWT